jgi:hypothetical protein
MNNVMKDVLFGRSDAPEERGVTSTVTIALGIPACSTIFSVVNGVLVPPLL